MTQLVRVNGMHDENVFLCVVDDKELCIYSEKRKDCKPVFYGENYQDFNNLKICKVVSSYNSKFFAVGIPEKRALGFFSFDRINCVSKNLKWFTKVPFIDFYCDMHLSSIMFLQNEHDHDTGLEKERRFLDYQFILWKFDTKSLNHNLLHRLDVGKAGSDDEDDLADTLPRAESIANYKKEQKDTTKSACCSIF